jgi:hypothetical protein
VAAEDRQLARETINIEVPPVEHRGDMAARATAQVAMLSQPDLEVGGTKQEIARAHSTMMAHGAI